MFFTTKFKSRFELLTLYFGIITFVAHALVILLLKCGLLDSRYFPVKFSKIYPSHFPIFAVCVAFYFCSSCRF